jgi:hypothetical protein
MVSMFVNGQEEWILMDDHIPVKNDRPVFVSSKYEGEVWPSLLEKAWAKMIGSYTRVESGYPSDAMLHLLGVPGKTYHNSDGPTREKLPRKLTEACRRNFSCFAITYSKSSGKNFYCVAPGHAYEIKQIHDIGTDTLLRMRNPWGHNKYSGAYAADSSKWSEELKQQVNYSDINDDPGIFFMKW